MDNFLGYSRTRAFFIQNSMHVKNKAWGRNYGQNFINQNHRPCNNKDQFESKHKRSESDEDICNVKDVFNFDECQSFDLANLFTFTAQNMKFCIKDLFSKCGQFAGNSGFGHIY